MPDPFAKPQKTKKILRTLKAIFLKKFPMNFLGVLIIIALSTVAINYMKPVESPTGYVTLEQECPTCVCEEKVCEEKVCEEKECETDCSLCPIKTKVETNNIIYYKCQAGALVKDLEECDSHLPNVSKEYSGTVEGVTLAIDNIEYEKDEEDSGFVTRVDYTIINKGEFPVVPKIQVKVYKEWSLKVKKDPPNKILDPEIVVNPNDYVRREDRVRIYFKGEEQTLRLLLADCLPDPDREVLAVTRDFDLDDLY
ncbi:hypothetical protein KY366_02190 [Candidatus Woesearchaeota archaeon]|nr:hypothetical protein [Candidatus Woesearchaeota archaeon]